MLGLRFLLIAAAALVFGLGRIASAQEPQAAPAQETKTVPAEESKPAAPAQETKTVPAQETKVVAPPPAPQATPAPEPQAAPAQETKTVPAQEPKPAAPAPLAAPTGERQGEPAAAGQATPAAAPSNRLALVDRIVAVVNSEVITQFELTERLNRVLKELEQRGVPLPPRDQLERQVLERMILDKVQLQLAKDTGLKVDDLDLDRTIARIAQGNRLTLAEFRRRLEADGISFDKFREEVRNEITLSRLREREVDNKITVAESEVDTFLADQASNKEEGTEYNVAHILLRVPEQARPEQIEQQRSRANDVVKRLRGGADFAQVAAVYSDAPDALRGGEMGWRNQDHLPELFVESLAKLRPGDVSDPLRSPAGFHVLKLIDRRGVGTLAAVEQTRVRHILVRTNEIVSEDEAKRKLTQLRDRILHGSDFAELARLYSDDASASRGGELGWVYPGDTVPEFERAFSNLKEGEVSEPVKTPFGWHLIQVMERRTADASTERKRLEARKSLRERKSDEAYQEWLRQMRDRAYVEYRLDER
jgi:peptidyl-prolyl cis-trans isomerase SurA